jgi:hypothetical protein
MGHVDSLCTKLSWNERFYGKLVCRDPGRAVELNAFYQGARYDLDHAWVVTLVCATIPGHTTKPQIQLVVALSVDLEGWEESASCSRCSSQTLTPFART